MGECVKCDGSAIGDEDNRLLALTIGRVDEPFVGIALGTIDAAGLPEWLRGGALVVCDRSAPCVVLEEGRDSAVGPGTMVSTATSSG
jgi:hypothetical protein